MDKPKDIRTDVAAGATPEGTGQPSTRKLGLPLLSGVVVASMIGGGAFNLPQNMAQGAALGAVVIAWVITLVGMFFLSNTFRTLADKRPDLKAGIYSYAREGFGPFAGFEMAWGYWLSAAFGNVAFAILFMQTLGYFFPVFKGGSSWPAITGASALIWVMNFIVLSGVKRAAILNVIASVLNISSILVALASMFVAFKADMFSFDFWGHGQHLGSIVGQVKSTMLVTLWVFIGIEGAVVVSDRASKTSQVGTATFLGLSVCTVLYFLLSALPFGVMHQSELAGLSSPSAAYVLKAAVGDWGAVFISAALLMSLLSCWLAWTILVAELPYEGAKDGVFPKFLARENRFHAAAPSLWVSSSMMQAAVFVVLFAHDAWNWLISITGVMILPPYLSSAAFLWLYATQSTYRSSKGETARESLLTGVLATVYSLWLLYAAGPQFLLMSTVLFALGIPVFWWARREHAPGEPIFGGRETTAAVALVGIAIVAVALFALGIVKIG
ncbi:basic amino acid/polyamine antiporter [Trinickia caryophylli]|uniref:Amino acid/polyamine/organocation transporter, APC superfamily n=1 Tax=Trinickia caryophylli TaxID=28094 RepID=A0A1X7F8U2_TRICW|nr:basic amino acid/polyamine antiporter [Trinickia caryophylli]PMS08914.1 amino acid permease [Trinickia caryophylli]TRX18996.1 amino acid permease [Trinickia caryophylli]WQE10206.1 basic amino acid/polyamine antiporter [Trinickia caryophylli]SMF47814.1 amino acid/polyamine/organocation transporter, APC superfamily [Trinickia caryophylli]GLU34354.1 arginine/agmatine antiporter [Trinickia caryophylli]